MKRLAIAAFTLVSILLIVAATPQCSDPSCSEIKWGYGLHAFDMYDVHPTSVTALGIRYDPSGMPISPEVIDRLTNEVEACLVNVASEHEAPQCMSSVSRIDRGSFIVKIASDWVLSCDKTEQLLPVLAGSDGCIAKGITPTEQCPCRWRAGVKCPNVIIATPSLYLYKDALIRFITGCANPWASPALASCATPTTDPLSNGTNQSIGP